MFPTIAGLPTYGLFQTAALVVFFLLVWAYLPRELNDSTDATSQSFQPPRDRRLLHALGLTAVYLVCNFVVAKVLYDVRNHPAEFDWTNYFRLQHYWDGGYWGWPAAFLPAVLAYPFVLRLDRVAIYRAVSLTLPPVLVLQKTACLAIGCCTGRPTSLPWGMTFTAESLCPTPWVPVHPVPLYDIAIALAIYGVLLGLDRSTGGRTLLFPAFVAMYGLNRFATEFFRPEYEGQLSTRQLLALGASIAAAAVVFVFPGVWRRLIGASPANRGQ